MEKQYTISKSHLAAARAVDQLRRQLGIVFQEASGVLRAACPIEGLTPELLTYLPTQGRCVLITGARARSLKLKAGDDTAVLIDAQELSLPVLQVLADPLAEKIPLPELKLLPATDAHRTLLALVKHAALLPALLIIESDTLPRDWPQVAIADVQDYWASPVVDIVPLATAALPIEGAEHATLTCLRERHGTSVHLVLTIGDIHAGDAPMVRVHSSCVTGDILGSLRCDCGGQLKLALAQISEAGAGLLVYLHQEGRGIGLTNKLRAYALQEQGVDTYDANVMLGFEEDERDFSIAAAILKKLGVSRIRLLTNNPRKIENLGQHGVTVTERVKLVTEGSRHSHAYLDAKAKKSGHLF